MSEPVSDPPAYTVTTCLPGDLSKAELAACLAVIKEGGAVAVDTEKLVRAQVLAVARFGDKIVGIGSIKRVRPDYASTIALRSGFSFPSQMPELGYVAVTEAHRRHRLSGRLVAALGESSQAGLFATTYDDRMKKTLARAGFAQKGNEWMGRTHRLSLWVRE